MSNFREGLRSPVNVSAVVILGIYTILWGMWIANPFWNVFDRADLYGVMSTFAGELVWGAWAIFIGMVTVYGSLMAKPPYIYYGAGAAGIHWFTISIFYFLGDWQNTGGITSLTFAIYSAFVYANVKINYENDDLTPGLRD